MKRGKPDAFTAEQNDALRAALADLQERKSMTQAKLGGVLGVNQQNAGRLVRAGGFSYASATRLVRFLGFAGVDTFFRSRDVVSPDVRATG